MGFPKNIGVIDCNVGIPMRAPADWLRRYGYGPLLMDRGSREEMTHPGGYMFKNVPNLSGVEDYPAFLVAEMDRFHIERALIPVDFDEPVGRSALERYPDRFLGNYLVNPNLGMEGVRALERAVRELGAVAATGFPSGYTPQVPIDDKRFYPIYAKCVELDIPIFLHAGVPGPRVPMQAQHVERLDEVCWFFPELRVIARHGGEPWTALLVKLMLKWPNLYYATSAYAPRYYPRDILEFANSRGPNKVLYAGYFPSGLSFDRIFQELEELPLRDQVWPRFLRENAMEVLKLNGR